MAYYDFKKKPALTTKEGEKDVLYPSIVFNGTINTKQLLKQLVARTGYKPGSGRRYTDGTCRPRGRIHRTRLPGRSR